MLLFLLSSLFQNFFLSVFGIWEIFTSTDQCFRNLFIKGFWNDSVPFIVLDLFFAAVVGLIYGCLHGFGDFVGVHYGFTIDISRSPPHSLNHGTARAEHSFFVSIQNSNQRNLW